MVAELRRGEDPVEVRAEAEEGDVAEVEEAGEADDDVQAEGEQRVDEREEAVPEDVPLGREVREGGRRDHEDEDARRGRKTLPPPLDRTAEAGVPLAPALDLRDPLVDADPRPVDRVGRSGSLGSAVRHQAFWITACPKRPLGRMRMTRMSRAKT